MKLISFAIPSYNSQDYLGKCVETLLAGGEEVEIIIVNDGSTDNTKDVADFYVNKYPNIVRACHKENGGHGSGVNKGLELATGLYFKVVDSDDWVDEAALLTLLDTIRTHVENNEEADLYITNFVYNKVSAKKPYISNYRKEMPTNKFFTWNEVKPIRGWKMLLMHSLLYKTEKLRASGIKLPEHTFYVDNIFAYQPLPLMEKLYYLDINLYYYYIGRADQSVSIDNVVKRYEQQVRVMNEMLYFYSYEDIKSMNKSLRQIMFHCLYAIMNNTVFFTTAKDSPERRELYYQMWNQLKERDEKLYRHLKHHTSLCVFNAMPWKVKGFSSTTAYKILCKVVKLGA